jgi:molybdopterin-guanine dinucleotide biosynthesis protein A
MITPVILCGGTGTRLWPLSRKSLPKQFAPIVGDKSLYQLTLERCSKLSDEIITVASEDHRFMVMEAMDESRVRGAVILEPMGRNTAAAMALAALNQVEIGAGDDLLLFCPADHFVPDLEAFAETIKQGMSAAQSGAIVTYGIVPTFPSTAYGYIQHGHKCHLGGQCHLHLSMYPIALQSFPIEFYLDSLIYVFRRQGYKLIDFLKARRHHHHMSPQLVLAQPPNALLYDDVFVNLTRRRALHQFYSLETYDKYQRNHTSPKAVRLFYELELA